MTVLLEYLDLLHLPLPYSKKLLNICDCSIRVSRSPLAIPMTLNYVLLTIKLLCVTVLLEYLDLLCMFYVHFTKNAHNMPAFCSLLLPTHYTKPFASKIDTSLAETATTKK